MREAGTFRRSRNKLNHSCGWKNQQTRFYCRRFVYPFRREIVRAAYHFHIITALHLFPDEGPRGTAYGNTSFS